MDVNDVEIKSLPVGDYGGEELAPAFELYSGNQEPVVEPELIEESRTELTESPEPQPRDDATVQKTEIVRLNRLPVGVIKRIMKMDPSVNIASAEAVFLVTKATELFIETIAREAYSYTSKSKKKVLSRKDLDTVIETVDALCFLDGALDF